MILSLVVFEAFLWNCIHVLCMVLFEHPMLNIFLQAFEMFQHMKEEERAVHDTVIWGAAPMSHTPVHLPPSDRLDKEGTVEQVEDTTSTAEDQVCATLMFCTACLSVCEILCEP